MLIQDKLSTYKTFAVFADDGDLMAVLSSVEELFADLDNGENCSVKASIDGQFDFNDITPLAAELFLAEHDIFEPDTSIQDVIENVTALPAYVIDFMEGEGWVRDYDDGSDYYHDTHEERRRRRWVPVQQWLDYEDYSSWLSVPWTEAYEVH